jgi:4-amino-4-deoxy-L-arabinose transferase-like glycosyltransferase
MNNKEKKILLLLTATIAITRVSYAIFSNIPIASDSLDYYQLAKNIVHGNGYILNGTPTAFRPVGYPVFLSCIFFFTDSVTFVKIFQAFLEILTSLFIFKIGKENFSTRTGLIGMLLWTGCASSIIFPSLLLNESLLATVLIVLIDRCISFSKIKGVSQLLIGVLLGFATLIKPQAIFFAGIFLLWHFFQQKKDFSWASHIRLWIGIIIVVLPWIVRNAVVLGSPLLTTNGGINLWIGNNQDSNGTYHIPTHNPVDSIQNEMEKNTVAGKLGKEFIMSHPLQFISNTIKKTGYLFSSQTYLLLFISPTHENVSMKDNLRRFPIIAVFGMNLFFIIIVLGGILSIPVSLNDHRSIGLLLISVIFSWIFVHLVFFGLARFLYPILPLFSILSAVFLSNPQRFALLTKTSKILTIFGAVCFISIQIMELAYIYWI